MKTTDCAGILVTAGMLIKFTCGKVVPVVQAYEDWFRTNMKCLPWFKFDERKSNQNLGKGEVEDNFIQCVKKGLMPDDKELFGESQSNSGKPFSGEFSESREEPNKPLCEASHSPVARDLIGGETQESQASGAGECADAGPLARDFLVAHLPINLSQKGGDDKMTPAQEPYRFPQQPMSGASSTLAPSPSVEKSLEILIHEFDDLLYERTRKYSFDDPSTIQVVREFAQAIADHAVKPYDEAVTRYHQRWADKVVDLARANQALSLAATRAEKAEQDAERLANVVKQVEKLGVIESWHQPYHMHRYLYRNAAEAINLHEEGKKK